MKAALILTALLLGGCSIDTIHTQHYSTDSDGLKWERHYLVIGYESPCTGSACDKMHKDLPTYNMKKHRME